MIGKLVETLRLLHLENAVQSGSPQERSGIRVRLVLLGLLFWLFATPHPGQATGPSHVVALTGDMQTTANTSIAKPPVDIPNIHQQPFFWTVMMASLLGWVLGMVKGFEGSKDWLSKYWPSSPKPLLFAIDFLIFVVFGAYIGVGLYQPANFTAALGAGLTWPVGLGALVSRTGDSNKSSNATVDPKTIEDGKGKGA